MQIIKTGVGFSDPYERVFFESGEVKDAFSIEVQGLGQLTGIAYKVPAHAEGRIKAKLQISALTSLDVKNLNDLAISMLDASYRETVKEFEKTSASANLSIWGWFFGGGADASYEKTRESMKSKGLSDA